MATEDQVDADLEHIEACPSTSVECDHPAHLSDDDRAFLAWCASLDHTTPLPAVEVPPVAVGPSDGELWARMAYALTLDAPTPAKLRGLVEHVMKGQSADERMSRLFWAASVVVAHQQAGHLREWVALRLIQGMTYAVGRSDEALPAVLRVAWEHHTAAVYRTYPWQVAA